MRTLKKSIWSYMYKVTFALVSVILISITALNIREFDTSKLKRILQSLETGLFFCQIFVFII